MENPKIQIVAVETKNSAELKWLHKFIHKNHSSPAWVLPSLEDLKAPNLKFYKIIAHAPKELQGQVVGISSYEIRTKYLVETQKTIVDPKYRGQGWGKLISHGMEDVIRKKGFKKIKSAIYASNTAMIAIKLSQGFVIEGYHRDHDGPGLHEYSLGKVLD